MRSAEASRADEMGSFDPGITEESVVNTVDAAYGRKPYGSETYPSEVLYWMGYVYRYWVLASGTSSRHAHATCGAREMRDLYLTFHALDPAQCVERILEAKGMSIDALSDANLERRALEILRRRRRAWIATKPLVQIHP